VAADEGVVGTAKRLYKDAGSLAFSSLAAAVFGAAFWAIAARIYPPEQVGVMTAVLAVINALGTVLAAASGDSFTALLPAVGSSRYQLYRFGFRRHLILSTIGGLGGAGVTIWLLPQVRGSAAVAALVFAGTLAYSTLLLQNLTLLAVGHAKLVPVSNIGASAGRIVILLLLSVFIDWHTVEVSFVVSAALVVAVFWRPLNRFVRTASNLPQTLSMPLPTAIAEFNSLSIRVMLMAAFSVGIPFLSPFLATLYSGPADGALFAICMTLALLIDFITTAMSASLVVHAASSPEDGGRMARGVFVRAVSIAIVASVGLAVVVPWVLPLLNSSYANMGILPFIVVLCSASVIRVFYEVWAELHRSRREMFAPLTVNIVSAVVFFGSMPILATRYGALGCAFAVVILRSVNSVGAGLWILKDRLSGRHISA